MYLFGGSLTRFFFVLLFFFVIGVQRRRPKSLIWGLVRLPFDFFSVFLSYLYPILTNIISMQKRKKKQITKLHVFFW